MDLADGWIVVRASDEMRVMSALRPGTERRRTSWSNAVERTRARAITFVAAPIRGWTIVLGDGLSNGAMPHLETRLRWLSRMFGEAQAFAADPPAGRYRWLRAVDGEVVRAFATERDQIIRDLGAPGEDGPATPPPPVDGPRFLGAPPPRPDGGDVSRVAATWSVEPAAFASDAPSGLAVERSARAQSSDPLVMPIAAVASRKEAALHVIWLFRQGCPRCGEPHIDLVRDTTRDRRGYEATLDCGTCGARCTLQYTAGARWDEQPLDSDPRLTALATPSPLLPPSFLLAMVDQRAADAQKFNDRSFAHGALEALDELLKHQDFVVPDPAKLARVRTWLRDLTVR